MDVSAVKYNKQLNAFAAPKISVQDTGDAFLSLLDNFRTSGSAEESSNRVLARISEKASAPAVFKNTAQNASQASQTSSRDDITDNKEPPKNEKPQQSAQKDDGAGQKIPDKENTAPTATDDVQNQSGTTAAENNKNTDNSEKADAAAEQIVDGAESDKVNNAADETEKTDVSDSDDALYGNAVAAGAAVAAGTQTTVQANDAARENRTNDSENNLKSAEPVENQTENGSREINASRAALPEATSGTNQDSRRDVAPAETETGLNSGKAAFSPAEPAVKRQEPGTVDVSGQEAQSKLSDGAFSVKADAQKSEADIQAEELSEALPKGNNVKIETSVVSETASVAATTQKASAAEKGVSETRNGDGVDETGFFQNSLKSENSVNVQGVEAVSSQDKSQSRSEAQAQQQQAQQQQQSANTVQNIGASAANVSASQPTEFQSALKGGIDGVSGVSGTSGSQGTGEAGQSLFNVQGNTLKGKAVAGNASTVSAKTVPTNELVDQIKVSISKAAKEGLEKININLKPKELGNIQVKLEVDHDGNMKASIIASRPETLDLLQKDASVLRQALADAGLKTGDNAFSFSYRGEHQQNAESFAQNGNGHRNGSESAFNNSDTPNAEADDLTEAIIASGWTSRHALNIRV